MALHVNEFKYRGLGKVRIRGDLIIWKHFQFSDLININAQSNVDHD